MTCEDWPACGHEQNCCPDFDEDGQQLNMKCVCGAVLPITSRYSICDHCMNQDEMSYDVHFENDDLYDHYDHGYESFEQW